MEKLKNFISLLFKFILSRITSHTIYSIIAVGLGYFLVEATLSQLSPVIGTLQNLAAAVFTLTGIWIAYSYPQAIAAYTSPKSVKIIPSDETARIEGLVLIVIKSAFVISALLIFNLLYLLISKTHFYQAYRNDFKIVGVSFLCYLSIIQLKAIFVLIITNIEFVNELHKKKDEKIADEDL
ncbi:MAG TPA: hypothetical protein VL995_11190 [Cellvibrio sp.]|nr:hypothetical protein [Cellvibrio sp.]